MKKTNLIILLFVLFASVSTAQEQQKENHLEFKTCHNNIGNGKEYYTMISEGYQQIRFKILGINNQKDATNLLELLKNKFDIRKSRIKQDGSFYAFIKKNITADQVRFVLLNKGYDYDYETILVMDEALMESLQKAKIRLKK